MATADNLPGVLGRRQLLDDIADGIIEFIRAENLPSGGRLPSASVLAVRFGVAVSTLREALRRLEATGAVRIKHGSGVYVQDVSRLILASPHRQPLDREALLELLAARELIEPALAEATARSCTPEQITRLEGLLEKAGAAIEDDDTTLREFNLDFHREIAKYGGNRVLAQMVDSIGDIYAPHQLEILRLYGDRVADHEQHLEILATLRDHDPERAAQLMREHLAGVRKVVTQALSTETRPTDEGGSTS